MAGGVDEVEEVATAVLCPVVEAHRGRLDRDTPFAFKLQGIEHLITPTALGDTLGKLKDPIGQSGFAVVDVGDDGEVTNLHATIVPKPTPLPRAGRDRYSIQPTADSEVCPKEHRANSAPPPLKEGAQQGCTPLCEDAATDLQGALPGMVA